MTSTDQYSVICKIFSSIPMTSTNGIQISNYIGNKRIFFKNFKHRRHVDIFQMIILWCQTWLYVVRGKISHPKYIVLYCHEKMCGWRCNVVVVVFPHFINNVSSLFNWTFKLRKLRLSLCSKTYTMLQEFIKSKLLTPDTDQWHIPLVR